MSDNANDKAARLADHFITVILETKPELIVGDFSIKNIPGDGKPTTLDVFGAQQNAMALTEFRAQLINSLSAQTVPEPD